MKEPNKQAQRFRMFKLAMNITQLGLSVIAPLILCMLLANWLKSRFSLGGWIIAAALVIGLLSMGMSFYRMMRILLAESREKQEEDADSDSKR